MGRDDPIKGDPSRYGPGDGAGQRDASQEALDIAAVTGVSASQSGTGDIVGYGREADMAALDSLLADGGGAVITEAPGAAGQGSLGKTWLARSYAAQRPGICPLPPVLLPLDRADRSGVAIAAAGLRLGVAESGSFQARIRATLDHLGREPGRPVILDDCPDAATFRALRPGRPAGITLATARRADWAAAARLGHHPLDVLDFQDSARLIARDRSDLRGSMPEPARIAAALDDVPGALDLAARTLAAERDGAFGDPIAYLQALRAVPLDRVRIAAGGRLRAPAGRERAVVRAIAVAAGRLDPHHGPDITALNLLRLASAFIPAQPFPETILRQATGGREGGPDTPQVDQALRRLQALGLLRRDGVTPGPYLPPLVAAYVAAADPDAMRAARRRVEATMAAELQSALLAGRVNAVLGLQLHVHHLAEIAEIAGSPLAGTLMHRLGDQMSALGETGFAAHLAARGNELGPPQA